MPVTIRAFGPGGVLHRSWSAPTGVTSCEPVLPASTPLARISRAAPVLRWQRRTDVTSGHLPDGALAVAQQVALGIGLMIAQPRRADAGDSQRTGFHAAGASTDTTPPSGCTASASNSS